MGRAETRACHYGSQACQACQALMINVWPTFISIRPCIRAFVPTYMLLSQRTSLFHFSAHSDSSRRRRRRLLLASKKTTKKTRLASNSGVTARRGYRGAPTFCFNNKIWNHIRIANRESRLATRDSRLVPDASDHDGSPIRLRSKAMFT